MRLFMAAILLTTMLAGCAGPTPSEFTPQHPLMEVHDVPDAIEAVNATLDADPCTAYNATHPAHYPYHDSGSGLTWQDYCDSPWDPVTLTGYDETYRPTNNRSDGSPYGVHLSFVEDPRTTLTVTWFTAGADIDVAPTVEWGSNVSLGNVVPAETTAAYPGDGAFEENPVDVAVHAATITGLEAGQTVWYRVNGSTGAGPVYSAHTDPGPGATVRIQHWGDQAVLKDMSKRTVGLALEDVPDLIVIAGDLSYANGVQWLWDDYFWYFEPLFARVPVMAVVGNHEAKDGDLFAGFTSRMSLPGDEIQYEFTYGPAHFTMIDTEGAKLLRPATQLEEGDPAGAVAAVPGSVESYQAILDYLKNGDDAKKAGELAWSFAVQHVPVCSNHESRGNAYQLNVLEDPWFLAYDLDLLMAGHNHMYERSTPMMACKASPEGYVQIINGGGGQSLYEFAPEDEFQDWSAAHAARTTVVEYVVDSHELYGYTYATDVEVAGDWELLDAWEIELE